MQRSSLATALALAIILATGSAHAQEPAPDPDKIFADAMSLVSEERYAEAIPKLEEAQRLDPGIGTQFNLAVCYAKTGRLALAWKNFRQVEQLAGAAGKKERADAARAKLAELRQRFPDVSVRVSNPGLVTVTVDGELVPASELSFIPLDVGEHKIEVSAPGKRTYVETIVILNENDQETHEVVVPALAPIETKTEIRTVTEETTNTRRTLGYVLGGIGVAGVAAATVTGILILSDKSTADERCKPDCVTAAGEVDSKGADAVQRGKTLLPINIVAWVVAGAGLGAGTFFLLTAHKPAAKTPSTGSTTFVPFVDARGASAVLTTTF